MATTTDVDALPLMVTLSRALAAAGVATGPDRVTQAVHALAALDPSRRADVYWAGRLTFCHGPDDLGRYDRVFAAVFAGDYPRTRPRVTPTLRAVAVPPEGEQPAHDADEGTDDDEQVSVLRASASRAERLRHRDVSTLSAEERRLLNDALAALAMPGQTRPSRRFRRAARGPV
ncbi:MAG: hypothetical protein M3P23_09715, partial [Actinomycetota bacterium]|nr:hypothetical protein [Actinomycetota bacterium]